MTSAGMQQTDVTNSAAACHISTNGCLVAADRWERRKVEAAQAVKERWLTFREACELYGLREDDLAGKARKH
jgi:hypothetical protein